MLLELSSLSMMLLDMLEILTVKRSGGQAANHLSPYTKVRKISHRSPSFIFLLYEQISWRFFLSFFFRNLSGRWRMSCQARINSCVRYLFEEGFNSSSINSAVATFNHRIDIRWLNVIMIHYKIRFCKRTNNRFTFVSIGFHYYRFMLPY